MRVTQQAITRIVQTQLAVDLNCSVDDLNGEKDSFVFVTAAENPGRRSFPRTEQHLDMLSMGRAIIVSATPELLACVRPQMFGLNRDEVFSLPFVYGHTLYYLPELAQIPHLTPPEGYRYELVEEPGMGALYAHEGFWNALQYDLGHPRPDVLAAVAWQGDKVVGMAGASADSATLWQVGMDVLPEARNAGIGAYLVNWLTHAVLQRGRVPYYGTASSNIASQRVAHRAGYMPAWVCAYQTRFDALAVLQSTQESRNSFSGTMQP